MEESIGHTDTNLEACRATLAKRRAARKTRNRVLWQRAKSDADRMVEYIVREYSPDRIIQWGSVLRPESFGPQSDIDIAVEGRFDAAAWFRLVGELWEMTDFPLDIVDLSRIEVEFADIIRLKGTVVYERDPSSD
jgi:predicted nucleotidyltransferase